MAWVELQSTNYSGAYHSGRNVVVKFSYDPASSTTDKVKVKLHGTCASGYDDGFHILWNPSQGGAGETVYTITAAYASNSSFSHEFWLSKSETDSSCNIPEYWIVNTGSTNPYKINGTGRYHIKYGDHGEKTFFWYCTPDSSLANTAARRKGFVTKVTGTSFTGAPYLASSANPSISVTRANHSNILSIKCTAGSGTTGQLTYTSSSLFYNNLGNEAYGSNIGTTAIPLQINASATKTVPLHLKDIISTQSAALTNPFVEFHALVQTYFSNATSDPITKIPSITKYTLYRPATPGIPLLTSSKNKLSNNAVLTFTWKQPKAETTNLSVTGYRIRLYIKKKGASSFSLAQISDGNNTSNDKCVYDSGNTNNNLKDWFAFSKTGGELAEQTVRFKITDPKAFGLVAGDKLYLHIYTYNIESNISTWSGNGYGRGNDAVTSAEYEIENAGIVHVYMDDKWHEGQVYVYNDGWHEAETVNVKTSSGWQESQ